MKEKIKQLFKNSPYLKEFYQKIIIIKCGGSTLIDNHLEEMMIEDIVHLRNAGIYPVLIHGGGKQISALLEQKKIKTEFIQGLRKTTLEVLEIVEQGLKEVNLKIVRMIEKFGGNPISSLGKEINKAKQKSLELGYVGQIYDIEKKIIEKWIENYIPVISCLAKDELGNIYNVNADSVACAFASHLKVEKLIFITDVKGVMQDFKNENTLYSTLNLKQIDDFVENGTIKGGMLAKVSACKEALKCGVHKAHIISGKIEDSLILELLTNKGIGTEIVPL
ncbi:MAG: acetylglutamate kinase [bacterium]